MKFQHKTAIFENGYSSHLDLSTCQITIWFDLSITRFSATSDCTRILEEVRDCRSGVETLYEVRN